MRRLSVILLLVTGAMCATAQTQLPWYVVGSGGSLGAQGTNRVLSSTVGQVIIGIASITDGSEVSQGFWLPINLTVGVDDDRRLSKGRISNYPNPFSASTTIRIDIPVDGVASIRIFDLVGNLVRTLSADVSLAGSREVLFDGRSDSGEPLATGSYIYEVSIQHGSAVVRHMQRLTIVR